MMQRWRSVHADPPGSKVWRGAFNEESLKKSYKKSCLKSRPGPDEGSGQMRPILNFHCYTKKNFVPVIVRKIQRNALWQSDFPLGKWEQHHYSPFRLWVSTWPLTEGGCGENMIILPVRATFPPVFMIRNFWCIKLKKIDGNGKMWN